MRHDSARSLKPTVFALVNRIVCVVRHVRLVLVPLLLIGCGTQPSSTPSNPDVLVIGFAGRCGFWPTCSAPNDNRAYLGYEPTPNTLGAVAGAFEELGYSTATYSFRSHLLDSSTWGSGYLSAQDALEWVTTNWIEERENPTRLVLVAHSHGNQFMSLLAMDNPELTFDWGIYLDAVCSQWETDHLYGSESGTEPYYFPGWFETVYGQRENYPVPLNVIDACDAYPVPGLVEMQDISDVVPYNVTWSVEVSSSGEAFGMVRDDDPNHRPDGTNGIEAGLAGLDQLDEGHLEVHTEGSQAMTWVQQMILLNGVPDHFRPLGTEPSLAASRPLPLRAIPPAPAGYELIGN